MKINMNTSLLSLATITMLTFSGCGSSSIEQELPDTYVGNENEVSDEVMAEQRAMLAESVIGIDIGAQSPRNIDFKSGLNIKATTTAPPATAMNLCDIHFHKSAEHKGGEFTVYAGNGNGEGYGGGYKYSGTLSEAELTAFEIADELNPLYSGDTIEVHYVYSSDAGATLGNGLGTCIADDGDNILPLLRVETQVYVLVNDEHALDFVALNAITGDGKEGSFHQAPNIPNYTGIAVQYEGSTTGPDYNEEASPYQVTWSVRPNIAKVNIETVENWLHDNDFDEHHAHAVRNLVINAYLLSEIK
jgi:hypothetical protein